MNMFRPKLPLFIFLLVMFSFKSYAFVEFHSHFGASNGSPTDYNNSLTQNSDPPALKKQSYLGLDGIARTPFIPLRLGFRYEKIGENHEQDGQKVLLNASRLSGLVNLRIINDRIYFGLIGTFGLIHNIQMSFPTEDQYYISSTGRSYSYGLEGGVKWGPLRVGVEGGLLFLSYKHFNNKTGAIPYRNGEVIDKIDLSAPYYKFKVGVGF